MRILYLSHRLPSAPDRGDRIPAYHQVRHLARSHELTVVCPLVDAAEALALSGMQRWGARIEAVPFSSRRGWLRALCALAGPRPITAAYFESSALRAIVSRLLADEAFDLVLVSGSGLAPLVLDVESVRRVMAFVDLDSQKWAEYGQRCRGPLGWIYRREGRRLLELERTIADHFDQSLVCTPAEVADVQRLIPGAPVQCVPNGVDLEFFTPPSRPRAGAGLVFTGQMSYRPNVDAMLWFCEAILPTVQRAIPDAHLTIVGARPSRAVQLLARLPGVTVTGRVPDVRPALHRAVVGLAPLRLGRGIQNKLLEAMATGLPCVATRRVAAGVEAVPGQDLLVADEPRAFAHAVIGLLRDPALRALIGQAARRAMERSYPWDRILTRLDAILEQVIQAGEPSPPPTLADEALSSGGGR